MSDLEQLRDLQRVNIKISLEGPPALDWDLLLAIFGRWRLEEGEEIVDLADYSHVPEGPNVLLISHRWQFGVDDGDGWRGLFYSTRKGLEGDLENRLRGAFAGLLEKAKRLFGESELPAGVRLDFRRIQVVVNDRLRCPNDEASATRVEPALRAVLDRLLEARYTLERERDPSRRLGFEASSAAGDIDLDRALAAV